MNLLCKLGLHDYELAYTTSPHPGWIEEGWKATCCLRWKARCRPLRISDPKVPSQNRCGSSCPIIGTVFGTDIGYCPEHGPQENMKVPKSIELLDRKSPIDVIKVLVQPE